LGSVSIVRRFDSPKIKLKLALTLTLTLTDTGGGILTLTDTGDLRIIEPSDYRADTINCWLARVDFSLELRLVDVFHCDIEWVRNV